MTKFKFLAFTILTSLLVAGCATTPEEAEYRKNKAIVDSVIMEAKPKPIIKPSQAVISDTIRNKK